MAGNTKGTRTTDTAERWRRIVRLMDETFENYLSGVAALRKRVVVNLRRKLSDSNVLDHPGEGSTPRSARVRRR